MDINESYFDTTKSKKQHIYYCSTFQSQYGLPTMSIHIYVKVDLYSGCDSDVTSNEIVAMEKRCYCKIIAFFLSHRYYHF